jgi:imidazolonepropionase-like amidohydrolase
MAAKLRGHSRTFGLIAAGAFWLFAGALSALPSGAQDLTLANAVLIDGTGAAPVRNATIVVRGGKIASIDSRGAAAPPGAIDLGGRYVIPGFIDAHSHLNTPDAARRALRAGTTTVRVLGDTMQQGIGTRDLVRGGHIEGPELLCSGPIIRPLPGTEFYMAFPQFGRFMDKELRGPQVIAEVVRAVLDRGADVIKLGATERAGRASTDPRRQELTRDEMKAAVEEARKRGVRVAAHAHGEGGAEAAVRAGVDSIEHGTYLNEATLRLMKERGTSLVPTLAIMSPLGDPPGEYEEAQALRIRTWHMQTALRKVVKRARELGILIAAATDGSYGAADETAKVRVAHDIEEMIACGFSPMDGIVAATLNSAKVLGIESRTGTVAVGKEADLVVLDRSPLEDPRVLYEPLVVVNNGKVALNRIY